MLWGAGGQLPAEQTPPGAAGVRGAGWQRGVSDGKGVVLESLLSLTLTKPLLFCVKPSDASDIA